MRTLRASRARARAVVVPDAGFFVEDAVRCAGVTLVVWRGAVQAFGTASVLRRIAARVAAIGVDAAVGRHAFAVGPRHAKARLVLLAVGVLQAAVDARAVVAVELACAVRLV